MDYKEEQLISFYIHYEHVWLALNDETKYLFRREFHFYISSKHLISVPHSLFAEISHLFQKKLHIYVLLKKKVTYFIKIR